MVLELGVVLYMENDGRRYSYAFRIFGEPHDLIWYNIRCKVREVRSHFTPTHLKLVNKLILCYCSSKSTNLLTSNFTRNSILTSFFLLNRSYFETSGFILEETSGFILEETSGIPAQKQVGS
eukprot:Lithocolla_globosa_v1_NODE_3987_length_1535_cov_29.221622.p1 type:complete len:122 gc:universal NODE_3987_length_1535_cov_29.221622:574-939(+)